MQWEVKKMSSCNCYCKRNCTLIALVVSAILGVVAAFLQIAGTITATPVFLWAAAGVAVVYLAVLVASAARGEGRRCLCAALNAVLLGILGTVLFSVVLLAVGIVATSVLSAVLVGLVVASLALTLTASACLVRCLADCED
jgi:hypothetical protein